MELPTKNNSFTNLAIALLIMLCGAMSYANTNQATNSESASEDVETLVVSNPDLTVLRRMATFRGPYSDQDDPILKKRKRKRLLVSGLIKRNSCVVHHPVSARLTR